MRDFFFYSVTLKGVKKGILYNKNAYFLFIENYENCQEG